MHSLRNRRCRVCDGSCNRNKETKQNTTVNGLSKKIKINIATLKNGLANYSPCSRSLVDFRLIVFFSVTLFVRTKNFQIAAIFFSVFGLLQHKTYWLDLRSEICQRIDCVIWTTQNTPSNIQIKIIKYTEKNVKYIFISINSFPNFKHKNVIQI